MQSSHQLYSIWAAIVKCSTPVVRLRQSQAVLSFMFQLNARISRLTAHRRSTQQVTVHRRSPRRWLHLVEAGFHQGTVFTSYPLSSVFIFDSHQYARMYEIFSPALQHPGSSHHMQYICNVITAELHCVIVSAFSPNLEFIHSQIIAEASSR